MISALRYAAAAAAALAVIGPAAAADAGQAKASGNSYIVNKLVSDLPGAAVMDPNLKNPWGVAFSPSGSPFWISDNNSGFSSLYLGDGKIVPLGPNPPGAVIIPGINGNPGTPSGVIWNGSSAFKVPNTSSTAAFIFDTEDGTIAAWGGGLTPANQAVTVVDNSAGGTGAVYKGLASGVNVHGFFLFATNFRAAAVEVYDSNFQLAATAGGFQDPGIPAGYSPYGIFNIDGNLWVTYAKQNATKHDSAAGPGRGFVDVFDTDGNLLMQFAQQGTLNAPWGVARASQAFGMFSGDILVGNFGDGRVNVFDSGGNFLAQLMTPKGTPLVIDDLWTLTLGGGAKSSSSTLYFTAGIHNQTDGLFGTITPAGVSPNP